MGLAVGRMFIKDNFDAESKTIVSLQGVVVCVCIMFYLTDAFSTLMSQVASHSCCYVYTILLLLLLLVCPQTIH